MTPSLHIWTKVGNEEYDTVSYNVDNYDVQRFDDGDITIHELINGAFAPEEQVNAKQAELLGAVLVAAMGDLPMHMSALEVAAAMTILHGMIRTKGRASSDDDIAMVSRVCVYTITSRCSEMVTPTHLS